MALESLELMQRERLYRTQRAQRKPTYDAAVEPEEIPKSFVTVQLYGKLAERWIYEKGTDSDEAFIFYLLNLRNKYRLLKSSCQCDAAKEFDESCQASKNVLHSIGGGGSLAEADPVVVSMIMNDGSEQRVNIEVEEGYCMDEILVKDFDFEEDVQYRRAVPHHNKTYNRTCQMCQKVVAKGVNMKYHMLSKHFTLYVSCKSCGTKQRSSDSNCGSKNNLVEINEYYQHMSSTHQMTEFGCMFCEVSSVPSDITLFRDHLVKKHSTKLMCRCNFCHGDDLKCKDDKGLIRALSLKSHLNSKHMLDKSRQAPCELCGVLIAESSMAKHIKNRHEEKTSDESNLCDLCGKCFVHLKQHKITVHKKESWRHKCKTCGKLFAKRYNLEVHVRLHTGERPFVCEVCGKTFCQNIELKSHIKNNHSKEKAGTRSRKAPNKGTSMSMVAKTDCTTSTDIIRALSAVKSTADARKLHSTAMETTAPYDYSIVTQDAPVFSAPQKSTLGEPVLATLVTTYPLAGDSVAPSVLPTQGSGMQNLTPMDLQISWANS